MFLTSQFDNYLTLYCYIHTGNNNIFLVGSYEAIFFLT